MCCISGEGQAPSQLWYDELSDYKESTYCMQPGTSEVQSRFGEKERSRECIG